MTLVHPFDHLVLFYICADNISKEKNVNTTSEPKHTNIFAIEVLKTDNMEKDNDNTKDNDSENPKKN